jgi:hypothetical protein
MREIRKAQAERAKGMTGGTFLEPSQEAAISAAIENSTLVQSVTDAGQMDVAVFRTARIFEEMCRRQSVDVSESMRKWVVRLLASELLANHHALPEASRDRLEILTALQGGIGPELKQEFGERFKHSRSYFKLAAGHTDPREYLQEVATRQSGKYEKRSPYWTAEVKRSPERGNEAGNRRNAKD